MKCQNRTLIRFWPAAVCEKINTIVSRQKHKKVLTSLNPFAIITL